MNAKQPVEEGDYTSWVILCQYVDGKRTAEDQSEQRWVNSYGMP